MQQDSPFQKIYIYILINHYYVAAGKYGVNVNIWSWSLYSEYVNKLATNIFIAVFFGSIT